MVGWSVRGAGRPAALLVLLPVLTLACGVASPTPSSPKPSPTPITTLATVEPKTAAPSAGETRIDARGVEQVWVPAGSFLMGTDDASIAALQSQNPSAFILGELPKEAPQHQVTLSHGYWIDKFEVTNEAFGEFVKAGGYQQEVLWSVEGWRWLSSQPLTQVPASCLGNVARNPVACISWYEAEAYASFRHGRLPTEAEWEYAARGPKALVYPWGDEFDATLCNLTDGQGPTAVGSYPAGASWVGAADMTGNVMEWVQDWSGPYAPAAATDPSGPATGELKIEKGGFWGATFFTGRGAYRHIEDAPTYGDPHIGFRVVSSS